MKIKKPSGYGTHNRQFKKKEIKRYSLYVDDEKQIKGN